MVEGKEMGKGEKKRGWDRRGKSRGRREGGVKEKNMVERRRWKIKGQERRRGRRDDEG